MISSLNLQGSGFHNRQPVEHSFTTGYLTQKDPNDGSMTELTIPNREIQWIFEEQIQEWFEAGTRKDFPKPENFCGSFEQNDTNTIEKEFASYLRKALSIRDTSVRKDMKENFYHGILLGLFAGMRGGKPDPIPSPVTATVTSPWKCGIRKSALSSN